MTHKSPQYKDRTALAPYNFVPLPDKVLTVDAPAPQDCFAGFSGWFECELETSSPTFIRGMVSEAEYQRKVEAKDKPEFFTVDGQAPIIPGSSLRGLFRLLVEVVSHSRLSQVTDEPHAFRALDATSLGAYYRKRLVKEFQDKNTKTIYLEPLVQAGYIRKKNNGWYIQPAKNINGTTFARINIADTLDPIRAKLQEWHECRQARVIYIAPGPYEYHPVKGGHWQARYSLVQRAEPDNGPGLNKAVLAESGPINKKKLEAVVFEPDESKRIEEWIEIKPEIIRLYRNQLTGNLQKDRRNRVEEIQAKNTQRVLLGDNGVLVDNQPVFYLVENKQLVFFGHTMMMRLPYMRAPNDLLDGLWSEATGKLDFTQALFGYVADNDKSSGPTGALGRASFLFRCPLDSWERN